MRTAVVVPTTTHYSDCWGPFMALFRKFWADCPYPVYMVTDYKNDPWDGDDVIVVGNDLGWCKNLVYGLNKIPADYIILLQEDFFLNAPTDQTFVEKALGIMEKDNAACFRLYPCPGPNQGSKYDEVGLIAPGQSYRVSCQAAIWNKKEILEIAGDPNINLPREFEIDGTNLVNKKHADCQYYSVKRAPNKWPLQYYCTAIVRGTWDPGATNFVKSLGITINDTRRPTARVVE